MLQAIIAILSLLPAIITAVRAIEEVIPMSGQGKAKTEIILQIVEAAGAQGKEMIPLVQKAITIVVETLNTVGIFKKG